MRTLIISQYFYPEPNGSAPPISDLALWLAEEELEPHVITARPSYPERVVYDGYHRGEKDREVWNGVSIRRLRSFVMKSSGIIGRLGTEMSFLIALIWHRLCARPSADSVISVCPSIFVVLAARLFVGTGGRHLAIVHDIQSGLGASTGSASFAMSLLSRLERYALNRADVLIVLSEGMLNALRQMGITSEIQIAPPQLDVFALDVLPEPSAGIVLYSGALGRKQGLDQVVQLAATLQARSDGTRLVIRGQGGMRSELEQDATALKLQNLTFEDLAPRDSYNRAMSEGIVHLVPQISDGANFAVPSKVFSIMACGRPFVATAEEDSPLHGLAKASGAGICVPPNDAKAFADTIQNLVQNRDDRRTLGAKGRSYVETEVDRSVICSRIWSAVRGNR